MTNEEFSKYQVGDTVVIRAWNDMAFEYGVDNDGDIFVSTDRCYFGSCMRKYCGHEFSIQSTDKDIDTYIIRLHNEYNEDFPFTPGMFEHLENEIDLTSEWKKMILGE